MPKEIKKTPTFLDCACVEKEVSAKERSITQYASTKTLDRGKDIVEPKGINLKNFRKNPIVLFNHDRFLPIGSSMWQKPDEKGLLTKTSFSKTPFADDIYTLHLEKVLNAWSIGFIPVSWKFDEKENITTFTDIELFEYSSVTLPQNPDALDEAKSIIKSAEGLSLVNKIDAELSVKRELLQFRREIDELKAANLELTEANNSLNQFGNTELISDIEKLENEVDNLKEKMAELSLRILKGNIEKVGTLDVDVKGIVSSLK